VPIVLKSESLSLLNPSGPPRPLQGLLYPYIWLCFLVNAKVEQVSFWFGLPKTPIVFQIAVTEFDIHMNINIICVRRALGVRWRIILNFSSENKLWEHGTNSDKSECSKVSKTLGECIFSWITKTFQPCGDYSLHISVHEKSCYRTFLVLGWCLCTAFLFSFVSDCIIASFLTWLSTTKVLPWSVNTVLQLTDYWNSNIYIYFFFFFFSKRYICFWTHCVTHVPLVRSCDVANEHLVWKHLAEFLDSMGKCRVFTMDFFAIILLMYSWYPSDSS
jgi:hypothetical protein